MFLESRFSKCGLGSIAMPVEFQCVNGYTDLSIRLGLAKTSKTSSLAAPLKKPMSGRLVSSCSPKILGSRLEVHKS